MSDIGGNPINGTAKPSTHNLCVINHRYIEVSLMHKIINIRIDVRIFHPSVSL